MRAVKAVPFAACLLFGVDTLTALTQATAQALVKAGATFRIGYIDEITAAELAAQLGVGLNFSPCTYANEFDGSHTVARLTALAIPKGVTVWLDVESVQLDAPTLIAQINAWATAVQAAGYEAGLYVGAGVDALLTSAQLTALAVTKYWRSCSTVRIVPARGYCMYQQHVFNIAIAGVTVDVNIVDPDAGDAPPMLVAA